MFSLLALLKFVGGYDQKAELWQIQLVMLICFVSLSLSFYLKSVRSWTCCSWGSLLTPTWSNASRCRFLHSSCQYLALTSFSLLPSTLSCIPSISGLFLYWWYCVPQELGKDKAFVSETVFVTIFGSFILVSFLFPFKMSVFFFLFLVNGLTTLLTKLCFDAVDISSLCFTQ